MDIPLRPPRKYTKAIFYNSHKTPHLDIEIGNDCLAWESLGGTRAEFCRQFRHDRHHVRQCVRLALRSRFPEFYAIDTLRVSVKGYTRLGEKYRQQRDELVEEIRSTADILAVKVHREAARIAQAADRERHRRKILERQARVLTQSPLYKDNRHVQARGCASVFVELLARATLFRVEHRDEVPAMKGFVVFRGEEVTGWTGNLRAQKGNQQGDRLVDPVGEVYVFAYNGNGALLARRLTGDSRLLPGEVPPDAPTPREIAGT